jgi:hypothetical protein
MANRRSVTFAKVAKDVDRIAAGPNGNPEEFLLVAASSVSANFRDRIKNHTKDHGIQVCSIWSGTEFEEKLRCSSVGLLKRFISGEVFPESAEELKVLVSSAGEENDEQILSLMARLLDRPAFYTPFQSESSIPAFRKALTDTIDALGTGVHRLRDGTEIRRIPSRHQLSSSKARLAVAEVERAVSQLRSTYENFLLSGDIRECGCKQPDCPVFMVSHAAAREMDRLRERILREFKEVYPPFNVTLSVPQYR